MEVFLSWSGAAERDKAIPLLPDLAEADVTGPVSRFQAVDAGRKTAVLALLVRELVAEEQE